MEGQKNTIGATIRLQGSEEYVKRMQEIKQATRELREENERLNQSLEDTAELFKKITNCKDNFSLRLTMRTRYEEEQ